MNKSSVRGYKEVYDEEDRPCGCMHDERPTTLAGDLRHPPHSHSHSSPSGSGSAASAEPKDRATAEAELDAKCSPAELILLPEPLRPAAKGQINEHQKLMRYNANIGNRKWPECIVACMACGLPPHINLTMNYCETCHGTLYCSRKCKDKDRLYHEQTGCDLAQKVLADVELEKGGVYAFPIDNQHRGFGVVKKGGNIALSNLCLRFAAPLCFDQAGKVIAKT